eukprot:TRINITY_DN9349_c0_g1_i2.p1 TRINITY_DN9349_c0_g1~~TRINITY_DN9349_c0_g1_i2.p1  ORF type:complete len:108 (-),score=17.41 TRINITY_DN9349_c0_g1_i2:292-615(-)
MLMDEERKRRYDGYLEFMEQTKNGPYTGPFSHTQTRVPRTRREKQYPVSREERRTRSNQMALLMVLFASLLFLDYYIFYAPQAKKKIQKAIQEKETQRTWLRPQRGH